MARIPYGMHRYWRLRITVANGNTGYSQVGELEFRSYPGGKNQVTSTAGGSSWGNSYNGRGGSLAFDGNVSTYWHVPLSNTATSWVAFIFNQPISVAEIMMSFPPTADVTQLPIRGFIEYSDDGTNWTFAFSFQGLTYAGRESKTITSPDFKDDGSGQPYGPIDLEAYAELVERMGELLDAQDAALRRVLVASKVGPGPFALDSAIDAGKQIRVSHTQQVTMSLPANAPVGTIHLVRQINSGPVKFVPDSGGTLRHRLNHNATAGLGACVRLTCESQNSGNTAAEWWLDGDTAQVA